MKDSEFNPTGKKGAFGGYNDWQDRAGRYRSLGDGQIDFKTIFSKLTQYGCDVWAVMEWECVIKSPEQGAREGAIFIQDHIIEATQKLLTILRVRTQIANNSKRFWEFNSLQEIQTK